jgi:hypothetical protein
MDRPIERKALLFLAPPLAGIGSWVCHYFGSGHEISNGAWFSSFDIILFIGIALAIAIAYFIARAAQLSVRGPALWAALPIYGLVGCRLGFMAGGAFLSQPTAGLLLGALAGCVAGYFIRLLILTQARAAEGLAT